MRGLVHDLGRLTIAEDVRILVREVRALVRPAGIEIMHAMAMRLVSAVTDHDRLA